MCISTCVLWGGACTCNYGGQGLTPSIVFYHSLPGFFLRLTFVCVCAYECVCARTHICTVSDHLELELLSVLHHQHGCWELTFSLMQELAEPGAHPSSRLAAHQTPEIYSASVPALGQQVLASIPPHCRS